MPTYEYRCESCQHQFERFQRMSDEPVKECEICGEPVRRLLFPVAIHFKGSGFYSTDYGKRNGLGAAGPNTASSTSESGSEPAAAASSSESSAGSSDSSATKPADPAKAAAGASPAKKD